MQNNFKIIPLEKSEFSHLFLLNDSDLEKIGAIKKTVQTNPGVPCRISLQDAEIGEEVILLPYEHHKTSSPYRASGPIYVRKNVETASLNMDEIPKILLHRLLSLRAYNKDGLMKTAIVTEGKNVQTELKELFKDYTVEYIHIHNAKQGCYNCKAIRI